MNEYKIKTIKFLCGLILRHTVVSNPYHYYNQTVSSLFDVIYPVSMWYVVTINMSFVVSIDYNPGPSNTGFNPLRFLVTCNYTSNTSYSTAKFIGFRE